MANNRMKPSSDLSHTSRPYLVRAGAQAVDRASKGLVGAHCSLHSAAQLQLAYTAAGAS